MSKGLQVDQVTRPGATQLGRKAESLLVSGSRPPWCLNHYLRAIPWSDTLSALTTKRNDSSLLSMTPYFPPTQIVSPRGLKRLKGPH